MSVHPQVPQPVSVYNAGDSATFQFTLTTPLTPPPGYPAGTAATPVDPGSIILEVQPPVNSAYTLTYGVDSSIVRFSQGVYQVSIQTNIVDVGRWYLRWISTANGQGQGAGVREWRFEVAASSLLSP